MVLLKTHVALNVTNIEKSVAFYQAMFGVEPVKYKHDYAKFDISSPALNLTLNLASSVQTGGALSHLGIQVETTEEVRSAIQRFTEAGLALFTEDEKIHLTAIASLMLWKNCTNLRCYCAIRLIT